ncbi:MAG TPA: hypothetical protein VII85_03165 [Candidatus Krumholzibacteriaceae bacterium]
MRFTSFLISLVIAALAGPVAPLGATGLYDDLPSFFSTADSVRTLAFRQTECNLGRERASLLTGALALRPAPRYDVLLDFLFPTVSKSSGTIYGVGDMLLRATARIWGDTLNTSGFFLRGNLRVPSGSKTLRPFSNAALQGEAGLEARFMRHGVAFQAAAVYTLSGESLHSTDFSDDRHATLAASAGVNLPAAGTVRAAAFLMSFHGGGTRNVYFLSLDRGLSPQLAVGIAGEFEAGGAEARVFDSTVSISFTYRLPPHRPSPKPDSGEPPPKPDSGGPIPKPDSGRP